MAHLLQVRVTLKRVGSKAESRSTPHTPVPFKFSTPIIRALHTRRHPATGPSKSASPSRALTISSFARSPTVSSSSDPLGEAERIGISSAAWPLFGLVWPSGAHLAARLALRPVRLGERILEVGCGLALASLVGHRRGADVTASDRHPLAEHFLEENLRLNDLAPMKYRHGDWNGPVLPPGAGRSAGPLRRPRSNTT